MLNAFINRVLFNIIELYYYIYFFPCYKIFILKISIEIIQNSLPSYMLYLIMILCILNIVQDSSVL